MKPTLGLIVPALTMLSAGVGCAPQLLVPKPSVPPAPAPMRVSPRPAEPPPPPRERQILLGHSVSGRPLVLSVFGSGRPAVLVIGGIHGDEPASAHLARELLRHLCRHPEVVTDRTVAILPEANPDGLAAGTRWNARGVDLNRNFPARNWKRAPRGRHGPHPASEPETRAILAAIERVQPDCIVALHAITGGRQCNNFDGPARELAELLSRHNGYPVRPRMGYPTPGSLGSWAGGDRAWPTLTLELPRHRAADRCWEENRAALLALLEGVSPRPALGR